MATVEKPRMWRRVLGWVAVGFGLLASWVAVLIVLGMLTELQVKQTVPVMLNIGTTVMEAAPGYAFADGTWTIDGSGQAWPIQSTKIRCVRQQKECVAATARIGGGLMTTDVDTYDIVEWTPTRIVFVDQSPLCVGYVYTLDLATKSASGLRTRRENPPDGIDCTRFDKELRLKLVNGFDVWKAEREKVTPWYGVAPAWPAAAIVLVGWGALRWWRRRKQ